jgi:hypothetical protein
MPDGADYRGRRAPSGAPLRRLQGADYRAIRCAYWAGVTQVQLASRYDVSQSRIHRIVSNLDGQYAGPQPDTAQRRAERRPHIRAAIVQGCR